MKKTLLILGIIGCILGVLALAMGGLYLYASLYTMDGTTSMYYMQREMMTIYFAVGVALIVAGIVAIIVSTKTKNN